jgi:hypothetical protein
MLSSRAPLRAAKRPRPGVLGHAACPVRSRRTEPGDLSGRSQVQGLS